MCAGGAVLQGATQVKLATLSDALALLRAGEVHKQVAATAMNETSSRAHTVFLVTLTQRGSASPLGGDGDDSAMSEGVISSQLALVDLAGCEQVRRRPIVPRARCPKPCGGGLPYLVPALG